MRAYRLTPGGGIEGLTMVTMPDPVPGPGEVLVRVQATSLNYRDLILARNASQPIVPLSDGAGQVMEIGDGVTRFAVGDRVTATFFLDWLDGPATAENTRLALGGGATDGMLAELVVLPERALVATPSHMTDEEAATLPCAALTAWNALYELARVPPGGSVLLLGTGGVSTAGLQLARLGGLRSIITSSSDAKLERARDLGADVTINYRTRGDWERAVRDATDGRGVDLTLEVGGAGTFAKSMTATRFGGEIAISGALATEESGPGVPLVGKNIRATRLFVGSRAMFERMNAALALRAVPPVIDRVFSFSGARDAYRLLESQAHFGKVVIQL